MESERAGTDLMIKKTTTTNTSLLPNYDIK